jgi:hypothetical protein
MLDKLSFFLQWKYLNLLNMVLTIFVARGILGVCDKYKDFYHIKE